VIPSRLIEAKRDGHELSSEELRGFFQAFLRDELPDYQMAAFLMAVVFRGMTDRERDVIVDMMVRSGETLEWPGIEGPVADKHSTGGVGDKVSLVLAPLAAELGIRVPMVSGRGLGHSGGTLDKLESIPGFRTDLSLVEFREVLYEVGCAMMGQTEELAPLDKRLYRLRNVTGTVPALPLIAASIMSKKLAEGLDALVLDVKQGSGAFLADPVEVRRLAETMVGIGESRGVKTTAVITAMDRPLGRMVGNALEVRESVEVLKGRGPEDLRQVVITLTAEMLLATGLAGDRPSALARTGETLGRGDALDRFARLVEAQGGDAGIVDSPDRLPTATLTRVVLAPKGGFVRSVDPRQIGWAVVAMGGGRKRLGDALDPSVGFELHVTPGRAVEAGQPLATVHGTGESLDIGERAVLEAVEIGEAPEAPALPLIGDCIRGAAAGG
jgi:pyrimidine-nucleoside phosphorylase